MKKSKSNREEKMSEIQERLMNGTKEIYESGKWAEYISVMSKFPNYSIKQLHSDCITVSACKLLSADIRNGMSLIETW
jgi:hypothetical protein